MRPAGLEVIVQGPESSAAKFEPTTRTFVPECPEVGVNVTVALIVNVALAKSTVAPLGSVMNPLTVT
jgi:hypothetical protein